MIDEKEILSDDQRKELDLLASQYQKASDEVTMAKTKKDSLNSVLKTVMESYNVKKYVSSDHILLSVSTRPNISFDEDKLLAYCQSLDVDGLVKTKEYVDMDVLESLIYHNKVDKKKIKECQIVKPDIVTLKCSQKKPLNEG